MFLFKLVYRKPPLSLMIIYSATTRARFICCPDVDLSVMLTVGVVAIVAVMVVISGGSDTSVVAAGTKALLVVAGTEKSLVVAGTEALMIFCI